MTETGMEFRTSWTKIPMATESQTLWREWKYPVSLRQGTVQRPLRVLHATFRLNTKDRASINAPREAMTQAGSGAQLNLSSPTILETAGESACVAGVETCKTLWRMDLPIICH